MARSEDDRADSTQRSLKPLETVSKAVLWGRTAAPGPRSGEGTLTHLPHVDRTQAGQHQPEPGGRRDHPGQTGIMRDFTAEGLWKNLGIQGERDRIGVQDGQRQRSGSQRQQMLERLKEIRVKSMLGFLPD